MRQERRRHQETGNPGTYNVDADEEEDDAPDSTQYKVFASDPRDPAGTSKRGRAEAGDTDEDQHTTEEDHARRMPPFRRPSPGVTPARDIVVVDVPGPPQQRAQGRWRPGDPLAMKTALQPADDVDDGGRWTIDAKLTPTWVISWFSFDSPHVRCTLVERACGKPNETELATTNLKLNRPYQVALLWYPSSASKKGCSVTRRRRRKKADT